MKSARPGGEKGGVHEQGGVALGQPPLPASFPPSLPQPHRAEEGQRPTPRASRPIRCLRQGPSHSHPHWGYTLAPALSLYVLSMSVPFFLPSPSCSLRRLRTEYPLFKFITTWSGGINSFRARRRKGHYVESLDRPLRLKPNILIASGCDRSVAVRHGKNPGLFTGSGPPCANAHVGKASHVWQNGAPGLRTKFSTEYMRVLAKSSRAVQCQCSKTSLRSRVNEVPHCTVQEQGNQQCIQEWRSPWYMATLASGRRARRIVGNEVQSLSPEA